MVDLSCIQIVIIVSISKWHILQGRVDDNIDTIKKRLKVFAALNLPVVKYYLEKGKLYKVILVEFWTQILVVLEPAAIKWMLSCTCLDHVFNLFFPCANFLFELFVYKFIPSLTKKMLQINAVGTVDEIYKQVYPVFASFNFEVFGFCFHFQFSCFPHKYFIYAWLVAYFSSKNLLNSNLTESNLLQ